MVEVGRHFKGQFDRMGLILVLSSPSGGGKSTVARALARDPGVCLSVSTTTRAPRKGEIEGRDYCFVSKEGFLKKMERGDFLEWAEVFGSYYGTELSSIVSRERGTHVVLDIDWQGAKAVKQSYPESVLVYLVPPSFACLRERLLRRGRDSSRQIESRMAEAARDIAHVENYDYVVVNENLPETISQVRSILEVERCSVKRYGKFLT